MGKGGSNRDGADAEKMDIDRSGDSSTSDTAEEVAEELRDQASLDDVGDDDFGAEGADDQDDGEELPDFTDFEPSGETKPQSSEGERYGREVASAGADESASSSVSDTEVAFQDSVESEEASAEADVGADTDAEAETGPASDEFYEDDLTPDAPPEANIDRAEEFQNIAASDEKGGVQATRMWRGETADGEAMYVTVDDYGHTAQKGAQRAQVLKEELAASGQDDVANRIPAIHADEERGASVIADVGDAETESYNPSQAQEEFDELSAKRQQVLRSASVKVLSSDTDIGGNVFVREDGGAKAGDFDFAGGTLSEGFQTMRDNGFVRDSETPWDTCARRANRYEYDFELEGEELREETYRIADQMDTDRLRQRAKEKSLLNDSEVEATVETIESLQNREI